MPIVPIKRAITPDPESERPYIVARERVRRPIIASDPIEPVADAAVLQKNPPAELAESPVPKEGDAAHYEVGYKRPPKHTQFAKGRSGNPKGRPKGAKAFNTIVRETLTTKIKIRTAKGLKNTSSVQALMMQLLENALKGSQRDRHELLRYYRDAIPDEPDVGRSEIAESSAEPDDTDAHDRAILERLRARIIDELGGAA